MSFHRNENIEEIASYFFLRVHLNWKFMGCKCNLALLVVALLFLFFFSYFFLPLHLLECVTTIKDLCFKSFRFIFNQNCIENRFLSFSTICAGVELSQKRRRRRTKIVYLSSDLINQDFKSESVKGERK